MPRNERATGKETGRELVITSALVESDDGNHDLIVTIPIRDLGSAAGAVEAREGEKL